LGVSDASIPVRMALSLVRIAAKLRLSSLRRPWTGWTAMTGTSSEEKGQSILICNIKPAMLTGTKPKLMTEITEQTIIAMLEGTLSQVNNFIEEAVQEVFKFLRPPGSRYKTNTELRSRQTRHPLLGARGALEWWQMERQLSLQTKTHRAGQRLPQAR
jgi:hypothetical protein